MRNNRPLRSGKPNVNKIAGTKPQRQIKCFHETRCFEQILLFYAGNKTIELFESGLSCHVKAVSHLIKDICIG